MKNNPLIQDNLRYVVAGTVAGWVMGLLLFSGALEQLPLFQNLSEASSATATTAATAATSAAAATAAAGESAPASGSWQAHWQLEPVTGD